MLTGRFFGPQIEVQQGATPCLSHEVAGSGDHLSHLPQGAFERDNSHDASDHRGAATSNLLKKIASALEITDLIALMMLLATARSAYATCKTAQVTKEILLTLQRPHIGTESVSFTESKDSR